MEWVVVGTGGEKLLKFFEDMDVRINVKGLATCTWTGTGGHAFTVDAGVVHMWVPAGNWIVSVPPDQSDCTFWWQAAIQPSRLNDLVRQLLAERGELAPASRRPR